jgi:hypothetical protein
MALLSKVQRGSDPADAVANGLGIFSIALGLAEITAPRLFTQSLGMSGKENLIRGYGAREIANGIGILANKERAPWVWGRVSGDALDIATLAFYLKPTNPRRKNAAIALGVVAAITALDVACAWALSARQRAPRAVVRDYSDRSGLPRSPDAMRGLARLEPLTHVTVGASTTPQRSNA